MEGCAHEPIVSCTMDKLSATTPSSALSHQYALGFGHFLHVKEYCLR